MDVYWNSLERWKNVSLNPVQNPVTPVRLINDPSNQHRIIAVSLPEPVTKEEASNKITEKWKDIYFLFPKNRPSNGQALEVRSPRGPRVFYGTLDRKSYRGVDPYFERRKWEAIHKETAPLTLYFPEITQFSHQQDRNSAAVLTPDVLAALYVASQSLRNKDFSESVRQIVELSKPDGAFNILDEYRVKQYYDGTTEDGASCRVVVELDGTGAVTGMSVGGKFQSSTKGVVLLMSLLPLPMFSEKQDYCYRSINRFHNGDGYLKTGIAQDNLQINPSTGEMVLTRESEWKDSRALTIKDCEKITTKFETCGDSLKGNFEQTWATWAPLWPHVGVNKQNIECKNLRLNVAETRIGKLIDPATKQMLIEKRFFTKKPQAQ